MALDTLDLALNAELAPYDDEEEIQLMDTDLTSLQENEPLLNTSANTINQEQKQEKSDDDLNEVEQDKKVPSLLMIEKLKVYIRDGPNSHHVETIPRDGKYYELPTEEQLSTIQLTQDEVNDIWKSLNLTTEDFRTSSAPSGISRPESLYVRGVNNMSTQDILNCFEEFEPNGIEWVCDHSCNVFWYNTLTPIRLLSTITKPGPCISHRRPTDFDHAMRLAKRKASSLTSRSSETSSADIALPPGNWREGNFPLVNKPESTIKLYLRYTTINDRKVRGAENQSEYYRQYGNPNYNNMTGLISRSKKRALNAMKSDRFGYFTVIKSNDPTSNSNNVVEEIPPTATTSLDDNANDANVKFTVVLPPKKNSSVQEDEDDEDEQEPRSKRQRRRSWDRDEDEQHKGGKAHFTVTIDSASKHSKYSRNRFNETSKSKKDDDDNDDDQDSTHVTDARQILERKRRNRH